MTAAAGQLYQDSPMVARPLSWKPSARCRLASSRRSLVA